MIELYLENPQKEACSLKDSPVVVFGKGKVHVPQQEHIKVDFHIKWIVSTKAKDKQGRY